MTYTLYLMSCARVCILCMCLLVCVRLYNRGITIFTTLFGVVLARYGIFRGKYVLKVRIFGNKDYTIETKIVDSV